MNKTDRCQTKWNLEKTKKKNNKKKDLEMFK